MAVRIGREVVREQFLGAAYNNDGGGEEGAGSSDLEGEDPVELQNGRYTAIGLVAYAVQADIVQGLSARSIDVFRTLSSTWHAFLGFSPKPGGTVAQTARTGKRKASLEPELELELELEAEQK